MHVQTDIVLSGLSDSHWFHQSILVKECWLSKYLFDLYDLFDWYVSFSKSLQSTKTVLCLTTDLSLVFHTSLSKFC